MTEFPDTDGGQIAHYGTRALHAAVIGACGNAHWIIADPRHCGFNLASNQCPPGQDTDSCLTPAQVRAVRAFCRGEPQAVMMAVNFVRWLGFGLCGVVTGAELSRPNPHGVAASWLRTRALI